MEEEIPQETLTTKKINYYCVDCKVLLTVYNSDDLWQCNACKKKIEYL